MYCLRELEREHERKEGSWDKKLPHWGQESSTARQWNRELSPRGRSFRCIHQLMALGDCSLRMRRIWDGWHLPVYSSWVQSLPSWSNHLHWDPGMQFWVSVITYVKPPSLPLLGHLSAVTNTDFDITCEKRGQGRTYRSQNKLQTLLESGNLLSSIFPQYKEFFPLSSCIIKSWGQSLAPHKSAFLECPWNFTHSS